MGPDEATVFVVHLWRNRAGGFRSTARRVDREETALFEEPQALVLYLEEQACQTGPANGPKRGEPP
jgi:hypothetical protein